MRFTERFDPATLAKLRRDLMWRGRTLATLLSDVLAGNHPPELAALLAQKPGMRPEEVLRLALDQVERRRRLVDAGDDRYGRCDVCGADLGLAALAEMPWADRCTAHPAP
jgi:RNA polymerase-binding transcription factor DksA